MSFDARMQLIDRLLALLARTPLTLTEITQAINSTAATMQGLLLSLCAEGIVGYRRDTREYHIAEACDLSFLVAA